MPKKRAIKKRAAPTTKTISLLLAGVILVGIFLLHQAYGQDTLSFAQAPIETAVPHQSTSDKPVEVEITRLHRTLPIKKTSIVNGKWEIYEEGVGHLASSANPGMPGTIIMYGHNTQNILAPLKDVEIGDPINIRTESGHQYTYIVKDKSIVSPSQVSVLKSDGREKLILYTCTGLADSKRLVVKAYPL